MGRCLNLCFLRMLRGQLIPSGFFAFLLFSVVPFVPPFNALFYTSFGICSHLFFANPYSFYSQIMGFGYQCFTERFCNQQHTTPKFFANVFPDFKKTDSCEKRVRFWALFTGTKVVIFRKSSKCYD